MSDWDVQEDGSVLGVATDRAVKWAEGDHHKLAAVAFVAWCRDTGQEPEWYLDAWNEAVVTQPLLSGPVTSRVRILLDSSPDRDCYLVGAGERNQWYAIVRVLPGRTPVVHILGLTATLDQQQRRFEGPIPRNQLLRCREWLPVMEEAA